MADEDSRFNPTLKDFAQVVGWLVAAFAALYGVITGIEESKAHREQQAQQLVWQRAELARQILEKLSDNRSARNAMRLLDYSGREFDVTPGKKPQTIDKKEMLVALRTDEQEYTEKEIYVRDCFDELFYGYQLIEQYIRIGLIRFEDIQSPTSYYINRLNESREPFEKYLNEYEFGLAKAFIDRFPRKK